MFGRKSGFSLTHRIHMKKISLLILLSVVLVQCHSTRVYIVRHAEKGTMPAGDPDLTEEGRARAQALAGSLRNKEIKAIYSTQTRRTQQTAEPLSLQTAWLPVARFPESPAPDQSRVLVFQLPRRPPAADPTQVAGAGATERH